MSARYHEIIEASSMWVPHRDGEDECIYCSLQDDPYCDIFGSGCIRPVRTIPGPDSLPLKGVAWQERLPM